MLESLKVSPRSLKTDNLFVPGFCLLIACDEEENISCPYQHGVLLQAFHVRDVPGHAPLVLSPPFYLKGFQGRCHKFIP